MKQYRSLYVSFHLHIFFLNKTKKHSFIGQYKEQSIPLKIIKNKNVFQSYSKNSIFFIVCDLFRISYILFIFCKKKKKILSLVFPYREIFPQLTLFYCVFLYYEILF